MHTCLKKNFWGLSREAVAKELLALDIPQGKLKMRIAQIWRAVYVEGAKDFSSITTLSKDFREMLNKHFSLARPQVKTCLSSKDGTKKWLLQLDGGRSKGEVEVVFIPEKHEGKKTRGTLCLSSQIGCTLTCRFCRTGTQAWQRNLTAGEIISQVLVAFDDLNAWQQDSRETTHREITHIVFMGQGEPLFNLDAVLQAIETLSDGDGLAFSRRRITISTAGVVPGIRRLAQHANVRLAISLHAADDEKRTKLIPLNNKYNIESLLEAVRDYTQHKNSSHARATFEYIMLDGINDSDEDARKLAQLIRGIPAKVNLIPFNAWQPSPFRPSSEARIKRFQSLIRRAGYAAPVRRARGLDIMAACGQLKTASLETKSLKERKYGE